jgi:hypothetical protein
MTVHAAPHIAPWAPEFYQLKSALCTTDNVFQFPSSWNRPMENIHCTTALRPRLNGHWQLSFVLPTHVVLLPGPLGTEKFM